MTQQEKDKSIIDTKGHIEKVGENIYQMIDILKACAAGHDATKLQEPELSGFAEFGPKLKEQKYGSEEYKTSLKQMKKFLDHHYENNRHHPEHFEHGIKDMNLLNIVEMLCDWKASCDRTKDGDIFKSIELNQKRFGYDDTLKEILINTAKLF